MSTIAIDVVRVASWTGRWWHPVMHATVFHGVVNMVLQLVGPSLREMRDYVALAGVQVVAALVAWALARRLGIGDLRVATLRR